MKAVERMNAERVSLLFDFVAGGLGEVVEKGFDIVLIEMQCDMVASNRGAVAGELEQPEQSQEVEGADAAKVDAQR